MAKAERKLNREEAPRCRKPGWHMRREAQLRGARKRWLERNPEYEQSVERLFYYKKKHARQTGVEWTLTLEEFDSLVEAHSLRSAGDIPLDTSGKRGQFYLTRKDTTKGFSLDNVVVVDKPTFCKLQGYRLRLGRAKKEIAG